MRVLFIGGTGNISRECVLLLHRQGHEVTIASRGNSPVPPFCWHVRVDRYDHSAMSAAFSEERFDVVLNFLGFRTPELEIDFDVFRGRIGQYVFISSATVYAKPHRSLPITEDTPLGNPYSEYAQNKQKCEEWLLERWRKDGFPVTIVRPSHTFGRTWLPNIVSSSSPVILKRFLDGRPVYLHNDGQNLWTLTWAADFAVGLAGLLGRTDALGEAFHITSDQALTWNQVYREIAAAVGCRDPEIVYAPLDLICRLHPPAEGGLRGDKAEHAVFDNAKIKRFVPEFECRTTIREGIRRSVEWFLEAPSRLVPPPEHDALIDRIIEAVRGKRNFST